MAASSAATYFSFSSGRAQNNVDSIDGGSSLFFGHSASSHRHHPQILQLYGSHDMVVPSPRPPTPPPPPPRLLLYLLLVELLRLFQRSLWPIVQKILWTQPTSELWEEKISSITIRELRGVRVATLERNAWTFWGDHETLLRAIKRIRRVKDTPHSHHLFIEEVTRGECPSMMVSKFVGQLICVYHGSHLYSLSRFVVYHVFCYHVHLSCLLHDLDLTVSGDALTKIARMSPLWFSVTLGCHPLQPIFCFIC